ncbi:unnamed protein product [Echinostoma caproni]|uniref:RRM domain-containing protein n=1 Tax=Echinostoma caproni TaxID=27848 RepID=A0A183B857_9TREM|nr:unnamed protein product [Echinostoma caproni]
MAAATTRNPIIQTTTLTVYNLPQAVDERGVRSIFPSAQYVRMNRQTDSSSSQSMCTVHFDSPHECQKVYAECQNGKTVGGRMLHVELCSNDENGQSGYFARDSGNQRDQSAGRREMSGNQRPYNDSQRGYSNPRGEYGSRGGLGSSCGFGGGRDQSNRGTPGHFRDNNRRGGAPGGPGGGRMNDYNYGRFDRDNRHGGGASGAQGNRHAARDSRDERRDRSPNRNEPVRGYGGGKGPRITSAVIRGNHDRSSSSESSDSDE